MSKPCREASLPEYIAMLGSTHHRAAQEYCELIRWQDKLEKENAKLKAALDLIINMDSQMFTLGDACSVAMKAIAGESDD